MRSEQKGGLVLVVDDEKRVRDSIRGILQDEGFSVLEAGDGEEALTRVAVDKPDAVLLDVWMPGMDGIQTLQGIKRQDAELPVVIMSGHGTVENAVKATRLGAFDFLEKPLSMDRLILVLRNAISQRELLEENRALRGSSDTIDLTGESPSIRDLIEQVKVVAPTMATILITGENGTGKELMARAIHSRSRRARGPFVAVNCAAIPETLIESELFGYERGAFTGAATRRKGKFDLSDGGTLFLDEVGDMSLPTQAKILRVLEERAFSRVGGNRDIRVDVRVLAATNKDLEKEIAQGRFREDLYFRLNVFTFTLPPLRRRREDIPLMLELFAQEFGRVYSKPGLSFSPEAVRAMTAYDWPGNVRELRNAVERLVIIAPGPVIGIEFVPPSICGEGSAAAGEVPKDDLVDFREARERFERQFLGRRLEKNAWNISRTAEQVGLERSNLHRKIKALGLRPPEKGPEL